MNDFKKAFGKRLSEIRKSRKLKQQELKKLIEAPTIQMVSNWENGHVFPSATYLIILAKKLDVSLDYLLLGKEAKVQPKSISTYKDIATNIVNMVGSCLFDIAENCTADGTRMILFSCDQTVVSFKREFSNLLVASQSIRPELFDIAVKDLLDKYDIPLKSQESEAGYNQ
jgi:transcriptional regulator with XRE-family HTH domain